MTALRIWEATFQLLRGVADAFPDDMGIRVSVRRGCGECYQSVPQSRTRAQGADATRYSAGTN